MDNIVRSVYGAHLQTCLLLGAKLLLPASSTLNEKLGIQPDTLIPQDIYPHMRYAVIGNGGHKMIMGSNQISKPEPVQHRATDASLFNQLPFVLREINNDLSIGERAGYGLRRLEDHDGVPYIAYYLKRLDYQNVAAQLDYKTVNNGVTVTTPFVPNNSNLNPVPPDLTSSGVNVTTGDYISATAKVPFKLTESEVVEILNVSKILYGDDGYAIISEIGLCSGVDKVVSVASGTSGSNINFNEVIGTQIVSFINGFFSMKFSNSGIDVLFDCGNTEALGVLSAA